MPLDYNRIKKLNSKSVGLFNYKTYPLQIRAVG